MASASLIILIISFSLLLPSQSSEKPYEGPETDPKDYGFSAIGLNKPLQIFIRHWHQDPQGYFTGGHEMYFSPEIWLDLDFSI